MRSMLQDSKSLICLRDALVSVHCGLDHVYAMLSATCDQKSKGIQGKCKWAHFYREGTRL